MNIDNRLLYSRNHLSFTIADLCDWVYIFKNERKLLPVDNNVKRFNIADKKIYNKMFSNKRPNTVFVKIDLLLEFMNSEELKSIPINHKFILISGDGDLTAPMQIDDRYSNDIKININKASDLIVNDKRIKKWCCENCDTVFYNNYQIYPCLLGFVDTNAEKYINFKIKNYKDRINKVFVCHRQSSKERVLTLKLAKKYWFKECDIYNKLDYDTFIGKINDYNFVLCANGGGIDPCPRLFEVFLMGAIPIIKTSSLDNIILDMGFPVIIVDNWDENTISSDNLYKWLNDHQSKLDLNIHHKLKNKLTMQYWWDYINKEVYHFDIVIPVGPNDKSVIEEQIKYTKKNIIGYRNIYLICYDPSITIDGCITINENIFPFNIETVVKYHGKLKRNGWYLQQLLKLYAGKIIPNILDKYLVIDSDTFFLKPTTFVENNKCLYNYGTEYHKPYFHHMEKLDKDLTKIDKSKSGICHHMIFDKKYIDELISKIEKNHNELFYNIFLKIVTDKGGSGASEYEIYFNYMLKYNPDKIQIRKLSWTNTNKLETNSNYDYISYHWYMR